MTVVFDDDVDIYFARQLVAQKVQEAKADLPPGIPEPELGPVTTGLGEIYQYELIGEGYTPMDLRTIQDWIVKRQLAGTPGLAEVNTFGGELKQYQVLIDPQKLLKYDLSLRDVIEAVANNNANAAGAYIEHKQEQQGGNAREVVTRVKSKIAEIQKTLPPGVRIEPFYDRTELVMRTIKTAIANLSEGALLVVLILLLLLMNLRGGFIMASVIPLSMLFAIIMMKWNGVSGNLMSLGAIDFGMIVDGAVVLVENSIRKLHERQHGLGATETVEQTLPARFWKSAAPFSSAWRSSSSSTFRFYRSKASRAKCFARWHMPSSMRSPARCC